MRSPRVIVRWHSPTTTPGRQPVVLDGSRRTDISRGDEIVAAEQALRPRAALLALAGDLADLGIRSRLVDDEGAVLRCAEDRRGSRVVLVACAKGKAGRLQFRYHPSGEGLGDAEDVQQPGQAFEVARVIAAALSVSG
jgi:hypothetical protein